MEPIQILSTVLITLGITLVIYLLKKSSESPFITKTNMKKPIRPSLIDQMLFYEKNPFAWRIGFAYSILGYNNNQIKEFNDALQKIVSVEKKVFESSPNTRLKKIINRFCQSSSAISQIDTYADLLRSHSIINESNPEEGLDYILTVEIEQFITETLNSFRKEQIDNMEHPTEEPPF